METPAASNRAPRLAAAGLVVLIGTGVFVGQNILPPGVRGGLGIICFIAMVAACSRNLRAVDWRTVFWGLTLQFGLAVLILKFSIGGWRPGYDFFAGLAGAVRQFLGFTSAGTRLVFGGLADQEAMSQVFTDGFVLAFMGLPTIIFVSSFFTVLYYLGILQIIVRGMAWAMMGLMRTSGAETLSAAANVFMGHTEAPLIIKPYVARLTESELLSVMVGGLATISGGMMAVYISIGADPVAILTTSVMAAPAGLYLSKVLLPETAIPETRGGAETIGQRQYANVIDAAAGGASEGTMLAINVAAMLIAFLSLLALVDHMLGLVYSGLSLSVIFTSVLTPAALLLGVPTAEVPIMADLLGTKLVANEFVAYIKLNTVYKGMVAPDTHALATYALTGFANFGSVGILLGGLGAMAPGRRGDIARLGFQALFVGFLATMINASMASMLQ